MRNAECGVRSAECGVRDAEYGVCDVEREGVLMEWREVCADPNLEDLPYKIELNEWGQIVMTPTSVSHGAYQSNIGWLLKQRMERPGMVVTECAIRTAKGTKVADVAWFSSERWGIVKEELDSSVAPEICVEVLLPGNSPEEIEAKKQLYFEEGAEEVWTCDDEGRMRFFDSEEEMESSRLVPSFPDEIVL